jgi:hypothetical protein
MELIQKNPYRIAGILSNASDKELQRKKIKLRAYTKVGKGVKLDYDLHFFGNIDRTENSVNKAFSNVEHSQDKVNYSLFWFLNISPFDNTAIEYLKSGDAQKSIEVWEKVTTDKDVNSKNFSAFNNLGTFKLISKSVSEIKEGIEAKIKLIESEYFTNFVHAVADETFIIDNQKQIETWIDELLSQFKNQYSSSEILYLFSGCNNTTQEYLSKKITEEPLHKVESQIENCKKTRKANKGGAYQSGLKLFKNTKDDLSLLKSLLGTSNLKYKTAADQLANEIIQCSVDYFNESQKNDSSEDFLESAQKLTRLADSIAIGKIVRDRVKDNYATFVKMKDREIINAIAVLQSIKDTYQSSKAKIEAQVSVLPREFNHNINWKKVDKLIDKSIDWNKVVDIVLETIPESNIHKIKQVSDTDRLDEYKSLVNFLFSKLGFVKVYKVKYLAFYWEAKDVLSYLRLTVKSLPTWAKWVGGIIVFLLLVWLIWGEEGLDVVFTIVFVLGIMFTLSWLTGRY